jgi:hypothetical protein
MPLIASVRTSGSLVQKCHQEVWCLVVSYRIGGRGLLVILILVHKMHVAEYFLLLSHVSSRSIVMPIAAASGQCHPLGALTRGDKVQGQRYACGGGVSAKLRCVFGGGPEKSAAAVYLLTLLCSQTCEVFSFALMAECPCYRESEDTEGVRYMLVMQSQAQKRTAYRNPA